MGRRWAGLPGQREKEAALFKPHLLRVTRKIFWGHRKGGVLSLNKYMFNSKHFEILVGVRVNEGVGSRTRGRNSCERMGSSSIRGSQTWPPW